MGAGLTVAKVARLLAVVCAGELVTPLALPAVVLGYESLQRFLASVLCPLWGLV